MTSTEATLEEDKWIDSSLGIQHLLSNMWEKYRARQGLKKETWLCFKSSSKWIGSDNADEGTMKTEYNFKFDNLSVIPDRVHGWLTSEDNSYGVVLDNWINGKVESKASFTIYPKYHEFTNDFKVHHCRED